jgi:predicted nucleic acid-binding protein
MSLLVDTSFFIALKHLRDADHDRATELFREVFRGKHGVAHTTSVVFLEAVTVALARTHRHSAAKGVGELIQMRTGERQMFPLQHVSSGQLTAAWDAFRGHQDKFLSMVDWTSVVVARELEVDAILSFDRGFDGIFPRLS